jgi:AraC-like DNA-binding protein
MSGELSVFCFVLESDPMVMQSAVHLTRRRMILVEQGEGSFLFDHTSVPFCAGTLVFGFEGERFVLEKGEGVRYLYVDFGGTRGGELCHRFGIYPHTRKKENMNGLIPFCKEALLSTAAENVDLAAESVLLYVFSRFSVDVSVQNDTVQKIVEYTQKHFQDPEISMTKLAEEIGYHPKYLSHYFKEKMHIGYNEYLRSLRFQYAISLFELGIHSVKNVAILSGFSDPLYFSNAFKKEIGISPKEFIAKLSLKQTDS